ncbi:hypothetical protein [Streptomyces spiralis]
MLLLIAVHGIRRLLPGGRGGEEATAEPQASQLWKAIRSDSPVPESAKKSPAHGGS